MSSTTDSPSTEPTCPVCELPWCACHEIKNAYEQGLTDGTNNTIDSVTSIIIAYEVEKKLHPERHDPMSRGKDIERLRR
jgi:heme A synthase